MTTPTKIAAFLFSLGGVAIFKSALEAHVSDHHQINMRTTRDLSRALDLAVEYANRAQPERRVTRASVLRAALVAHLSQHASQRVRATVARAAH